MYGIDRTCVVCYSIKEPGVSCPPGCKHWSVRRVFLHARYFTISSTCLQCFKSHVLLLIQKIKTQLRKMNCVCLDDFCLLLFRIRHTKTANSLYKYLASANVNECCKHCMLLNVVLWLKLREPTAFCVRPNAAAINKWTTTLHWVMACQECTDNYSYFIGIFTILRKTWELSHWIFRVTVCQLQEPRTLWHNAWSGYHSQNLPIQFPFWPRLREFASM